MASLAQVEHRNQDATVYVGNLDPTCAEHILLELFAQVGRVKSIYMPKDKLTNQHNGYAFCEFYDVIDSDYAITILNMIKLYGRPLKVSKSSLNSKAELSRDVGANLFIGNLDPNDVDENLLYDTFSAFGTLIKQPRIMRDEVTNESKGFGFVSFDSFEASDTALECMNGQYLGNRQIVVQYAFKKDTQGDGSSETGGRTSGGPQERHGSRAERMLAAQRKSLQQQQQLLRRPPIGAGMIPGQPPPPLPPPMIPLAAVPVPPMFGGQMPPPPPPPAIPPAG
jgi:splicing factor 3B subunit 4